MTIRARVAWAAVAMLGGLAWVGCVGDDPAATDANDSDASGPGSAGQPCFANGTCDEGLTCASNVCVDLSGDGGGDGSRSGDSSINDSSINDSSINDGAINDSSINDGSINDGATHDAAIPDGDGGVLTCGSALFSGSSGSSGGVISAPHITAYNPSGGFTVEAWVYPTAYPTSGLATIVAHELTTAGNRSWTLGIDSTGAINFVFSKDGTTTNVVTTVLTSSTLPLHTWSHVVGEFDGANQTNVWLNGHGNAGEVVSGASVHAVTAPLTIGNASDGNAPFTGQIEEVRVSNVSLYSVSFDADARLSPSSTTVALFHLNDNGNPARDDSSSGNDATIFSDASITNDCAPDVCQWVHLASGTVTVPLPTPDVLTPAGSFTLEGWFRENAQGNALTHGVGYELYTASSPNTLSFAYDCSGGGSERSISTPIPSALNTWHHWAAVFDTVAHTVSLYVDGVAAVSASAPCTTTLAQATGLTFGNVGGTAYDISEVRLSSNVRYAATFSPEKTALRFTTDANTIALYHFDEGSGTTAHDSSGTDGGLNGTLSGTTATFAQCQ